MKESFRSTLIKRIVQNPDFPAFARTVQEAYRITDDELASANDLSALILRDPALTHRILRLANAAHFRHLGGQINTVTRAVTVLGFEEVRLAALALSLFEQIESREHSRVLQSRFLQALYQAFLAQDLARELGGLSAEEMFLCALFQDFGALLVYRHAPEHIAEIERARREEGMDEDTAIQKVVGVLPAALARDVCRQWGLPESARRFLTTARASGKITRLTPEARALRMAQLARESGEVIARGESAEAIRRDTLELARRCDIGPQVFEQASASAREHMLGYEELLSHSDGRPAFLQRLEADEDTPMPADFAAADEEPEERSERLIRCIEQTTQDLTDDYALADLFGRMLEAMREGLDLDLAVLFMLDRKAWKLDPRMGGGPLYARHKGEMTVSLSHNSRLAQLFQTGEDRNITRPKQAGDDILGWQFGGAADVAMIYPLQVNRAPFGVFYLEGRRSVFTEGNVNSLRTLRNQAALAIKSRSRR
ncbi:HDOD domain-containing protein [Guyparkeria hydrothermalis]|uniref:HDOD domain-containing protein n=1 Tax=Guyparkeria hydrothermalis TaxID=923 RepID=UPI0020212EBD|nr:HDOD domain-containing protein [Guyparkeria hydrothermalis]